MKKSSLALLFTISLVLLFALPASGSDIHVVLSPSKSDPLNHTQDIGKDHPWIPDMKISFTGGLVSGYEFVGLIEKALPGTWEGDTWHPPLGAKSVINICKGKWVPSGGGGEGEPPPILYSTAINKLDFPDTIEFIAPTEDKYIAPGDSVSLEVRVKDQNGDPISGYTINWSINQSDNYFSISGASGYQASLDSENNTPGGKFCTVTATIQGTSISATSPKVTVVDVEIDTPASFPADVGVNDGLSLGSTGTPGGGTYSWTKVSGPGNVTFSPSATAEDPTFSADAAGTYTVKVEYTKGGATASDTSGDIVVRGKILRIYLESGSGGLGDIPQLRTDLTWIFHDAGVTNVEYVSNPFASGNSNVNEVNIYSEDIAESTYFPGSAGSGKNHLVVSEIAIWTRYRQEKQRTQQLIRAHVVAHEMGHKPFYLGHSNDNLMVVMNRKISNVIAFFQAGIQIQFSEASKTTIREKLDYE